MIEIDPDFEEYEVEALNIATMIFVDVMGRHGLDELVLEVGGGMPDMLVKALSDEHRAFLDGRLAEEGESGDDE